MEQFEKILNEYNKIKNNSISLYDFIKSNYQTFFKNKQNSNHTCESCGTSIRNCIC